MAEKFGPSLRECPNVICKESNTPDAPFCVKCRVPLTVSGYMEQGHQKDGEMHELREQMAQSKQEIKEQFQAHQAKMNEFVHDIQSRLNQEEAARPYRNMMVDKMREILDRVAPGWFQEVYGSKARRLTTKDKEKIEELLKILTPQIDAENRQKDLELQKQRKVLVKTLEQDLNAL